MKFTMLFVKLIAECVVLSRRILNSSILLWTTLKWNLACHDLQPRPLPVKGVKLIYQQSCRNPIALPIAPRIRVK